MSAETEKQLGRGSEWCRWEPHVHTPGTIHEDRFRGPDAWTLYLDELENASPPLNAIGVTDYCVTRSYERLLDEKLSGRLSDCELLFPNIELRLNTGTIKGSYVNIHLLVSPDDPKHIEELNRFLGRLSFGAFDDTFYCTPDDLVRLGQKADPEIVDEEKALQHGCSQFKVSLENLLSSYQNMKWARQNILIGVSGNADGTSGVREAADATLRAEIEKAAHVIFASSGRQRDFWLGNGKATLADLKERYGGPKPCLWGSDAHDFSRVANPDEGRLCWIKGKPSFDALIQACIDPERAYIGASPPSYAAPSQVIDEVNIEAAHWAMTPALRLNSGLIAVIGARGSGKTALVDMIAAGCDSYVLSSDRPSFLSRAVEHLTGSKVSLKWQDSQETVTRSLDSPINDAPDSYPRARYLSQQFVEELCSIEGMPALIQEIERVIFEAHPSIERDGAVDFDDLLEQRAMHIRDSRNREEQALAQLSDQIGIEIEKSRQVQTLRSQVDAKEKLIARYRGDREGLLPKAGDSKHGERLQEVVLAAEAVRGHLRHIATQQKSVALLKNEVKDLRQNEAPETLRLMKERHLAIGFNEDEWLEFLLRYAGNVDALVDAIEAKVTKDAKAWKGSAPDTPAQADGSFVLKDAELNKLPLAVLEAEIARLEKLVAADSQTAKKLSAVSKRITDETSALERVKDRLKDCEGARIRAEVLVVEREKGYRRVFDAVLSEERVLNELYAPLLDRLQEAGGTLAKLSFSVNRVADVDTWAARGEELFDLRTGPFKGIGSLKNVASEMLRDAWQQGDSAAVSAAMDAFRTRYQEALLEKAPYEKADETNYRPWSRRFAQWLYSTDHISIEYGIRYDGIDIQKLSPGTRGIVLVLLYLALDDSDDRPLIIDQPEENLDPKSIYEELVPLFQEAKRKRQVIMVTHNANLVINADADQIIVAEVGPHTGEGLPPIAYHTGGLEEEHIRDVVCEILEGGELAFKDRARRLRIAVSQRLDSLSKA